MASSISIIVVRKINFNYSLLWCKPPINRKKSNPVFWQINYLIECTVASIEQVKYVELCNDVAIIAKQVDDVI